MSDIEWVEVRRHGRFSYAVVYKTSSWIKMELGEWMFRSAAERAARKLFASVDPEKAPETVLRLDRSPDTTPREGS